VTDKEDVVWRVLALLLSAIPACAGVTLEQALAECGRLFLRGSVVEAEGLLREALREAGPAENIEVARTLTMLGAFAQFLARPAEAERLHLRAIALFEKLSLSDHTAALVAHGSLAAVYIDQGEFSRAERLFRRLLDRVSDDGAPWDTRMLVLDGLARSLYEQGKSAEAEALYTRAEAAAATAPPDYRYRLACLLYDKGMMRRRSGRVRESIPPFQQAMSILKESANPRSTLLFWPSLGLAADYIDLRRFDEAQPLLTQALAIANATYGPDHPNTAHALALQAQLLRKTGRKAESRNIERRAREVLTKAAAGKASRHRVDIADLK
jgi:tetratricopeptide (TPR) repeat protein